MKRTKRPLSFLGSLLLWWLSALISIPTSAQVPAITSFAPTSGPGGTPVVITGSNFNPTAGNNVVFFGAVKATVIEATSTVLFVRVPVGATFQPITVTDITTGLTAYTDQPFNITFPGEHPADPTSFVIAANPATASYPAHVTIADFDGDGKPDIAVTDTAGFISVFRNTSANAALSLAPKLDFEAGSGANCIATGDFDGDGKPDIAVTNYHCNTISVFRNTCTTGSISFAPKIDSATGSWPVGIAVNDLDGDGKPDIAVANVVGNTVSVFQNTSTSGSISFASKVDYAAEGPCILAMADVDRDGKPDIIVANVVSATVSVFRNTSTTGALSLAPKINFDIGGIGRVLAIADLNGDGMPEILPSNSNDIIRVLKNTSTAGNISFTPDVDLLMETNTSATAITTGDLNGDGKPDAVVSNNNGTVLMVFNNTSASGAISFAPRVDLEVPGAPWGVAIGDLDGDGRPDIAAPQFADNTVAILRNTIEELTPQHLIQKIIDNIDALVAAHDLSRIEGRLLKLPLNNALWSLERGRKNLAIGCLRAFIVQVRWAIRLHILTPSQAQPLIDDANAAINLIKSPMAKPAGDDSNEQIVAESEAASKELPGEFSLGQNFPNPFNPTTTISFSLPEQSCVSLKVFDVTGKEVTVLLSGELPAGRYSRQWNAATLPSGVYFYRLQVGSFVETKKLILLR